MPDTNKMTPAEYAAYTGGMSNPVGQAKAQAEAKAYAVEAQSCQAADADYVARFIRHLEDQEMRLVTERPNDWTNWGVAGKAAILAALREGVATVRLRAKLADDVKRCPRCDSPDPKRHPAMQFEGEVEECPHPFHRASP